MNFYTPARVAQNYLSIGKQKLAHSTAKLVLLGALAGIFIALGGVASATASASIPLASVSKLAGALIFPGGLTMVLLAGSELFTGDCLLIIPLLEKEIRLRRMLRCLVLVYAGNFIGSCLVAAGVVFSNQISLFDNALAVSVISTAVSKCSLSFGDALIRGILCNMLVCVAVWISFAAQDVVGKIIGIYFPVMFFVVSGFEHCVANMYYISAGIFATYLPKYAEVAAQAGLDLSSLDWAHGLFNNLLPVTLGNIIGGCALGIAYWFCYLYRPRR